MATYQCPVCSEQYPDVYDNGELYFHRCPPIDTATVLTLSRAQRAAISPALADAETPQQIQEILARAPQPRPGEVNMNIDPTFRHAVRRAGDLSPFPDPPRIQPDPPATVVTP